MMATLSARDFQLSRACPDDRGQRMEVLAARLAGCAPCGWRFIPCGHQFSTFSGRATDISFSRQPAKPSGDSPCVSLRRPSGAL